MKKMNVLFFIYQMGGGGAARTLLNIINHLDRTRFMPILVTLNFDGSYEQELKKDVKFIKLNTKRLRWAILPLARIIRNENIDLVFSTIPNVNTIAILASILSLKTNVKNIVREADHLGGDFWTDIKLRLFGRIYTLSDQIISLSEGVKDNLVHRYGVRAEKIKVIYNPVDLTAIKDKIRHGAIDPAHAHLFQTEEKIIITAGRLVEQKDHRTLLNAFSIVNEQVKSRLIMLGEGPLRERLEQQAVQLNIRDQVHFIGFQSNPYIYFKQADLFVLSSQHEGFSHVIVEALASGTPVVSTNCKSGPEEVLDRGKYGLLCEVGNAEEMAEKMLSILTLKDQQMVEVINKGYLRAQDFDAHLIVQKYANTFLSTLGQD